MTNYYTLELINYGYILIKLKLVYFYYYYYLIPSNKIY